ncbi:MAG: hypothetical protein OER77_07625 [Myxococcales bacterium]|nr:hypothetical protein [Myxococcales bacterium]
MLGMCDHQDPLKMGHAHRDVPLLADRMVRVGHRERKRIAKHRRGLQEVDAVFREVGRRLGWIPLERQGST